MTPDRESQIERIRQAALEREASGRATFLAEACAGDEELRKDIELLLAQESAAAGVMSAPAAALATGASREGTFLTGRDSVDPHVNPHRVDDDLTRSVVSPRSVRNQFAAGSEIGSYRVVRLLGRGGMGEVYEAEHLDTHRRVALKVLNHTLATEADRARFLREGQLAASVNHPNSVYVFATEELDGTLVIVMELASGGTLKDVVHARGPLPPAAAVDAVLQVIDGLEAAAAIGVLHRDVKPSNCFVDGDGTVKIGDFGLSIPTQAPDATQLTLIGTVLGTPAFAPPEQLRGESLDVRSDLYATGATLYYLLTGQPPFAGDSVVQVVANVLGRDADSPKRLRPDVPDALAQVVQGCLAKDPSRRPDSYQRLRRELLPFSSHALTSATPGARVMAAVLDIFVTGLPVSLFLDLLDVRGLAALSPARHAADFVIGLLYFGLLEGIWGASLGKMLFGIRIAEPDHRPAGIGRIVVRTLLYLSSSFVPSAMIVLTVPPLARTMTPHMTPAGLVTWGSAVLLGFALLFSTARRGNGFAGLHDLATRTRVVRRLDAPVREPLAMPQGPVQVTKDARRIGPYAILDAPDHQELDHVLLAYDQVLRRRVWIQVLPAGSPELAPSRRDLARPGRLRWLTGKRTPVERWDAYDAPQGLPFVTMAPSEQRWSAARFWLFDVVRELEAMVADHRDFALDAEHVWLTQSGGAILLDFRCPGLPASTPTASPSQAVTAAQADAFVRRFAAMALGRRATDSHGRRISPTATPGSLPLHAHAFLNRLEQQRFPNLKAMAEALEEILGKRAVLTRNRRSVHSALCALLPACALMAGIVAAVMRGTFAMGGIIALLAGSLAFMAPFALVSAAWFRGGFLLRAFDLAIVTGAGEEASRQRALLRAMVAWSPSVFLLLAILFGWRGLGASALVIIVGGLAVAVITPERGLQDRIARTWLVPR